MKNIVSIEIMINNMHENIKLSINPNNLVVNNKKISENLIQELIRTICLWKKEYGFSSKIDAEEFKVIIKTLNKVDIFHGKGIYPSNYKYFKKIIGEIYG